jgi:hypothetical protein
MPMPTSLNGWPVLETDSGLLVTGTVPGSKIRVTAHQAVLPLVLAMLYDYAAWVKPLRPTCTGGYAYRQARTGAGWSVHSAGAAWDINWSNEGAQRPSNRAFWNTVDNHRAVDQIKQVYGILEWGGDWSEKFWDPMHWQISAHANASDVARQVEFLGIDENGVRHNGWKGHKLPEPRG